MHADRDDHSTMTTLGRTGLRVSVAGLGAGGHSRLGMRRGASEADAADLVRAAVDLGITMIDTAPAYGTESAVGAGVAGRRDGVVLSSKVRSTRSGSSFDSSDYITAADLKASVEASLGKLRTDFIDILYLHGVRPQQYDFCLNELLPELQRLRDQGKIRFLGVTEGFGADRDHVMLQRAIADGVWDVLMVGYNFVNPSAGRLVLPQAMEKNLGIVAMYAVRGALADKASLKSLVQKLVDRGEVDRSAIDLDDPSGFLFRDAALSLTEAAYRFCRHSAGIDVVLTGTGNLQHLRDNIAAINRPPLPHDVRQRLDAAFDRVASETGDPE